MAILTLATDFVCNQLDYMIYMQKNLKGFEMLEYGEEETVFYFEYPELDEDSEVSIRFGIDENDKPVSHEVLNPLARISDIVNEM